MNNDEKGCQGGREAMWESKDKREDTGEREVGRAKMRGQGGNERGYVGTRA